LDASRKRGVDVLFNTPVAEVDYQGGAVKGVTLADGRDIATPLVINAAGPWCRDLFNAAGLESGWNLVPTRIQVLYLDRPKEVTGHIPVTVDMAGGIYFRTQNRGQQLVVSSVLEEDEREAVENPDCYNLQPDDDFRNEKLHILHHRLPALPYRGKIRGYCGLYTVNRDDVHPILGATALPGFWVANGFSGHGFKLAPAIGSLVAQAITGDSLDFDTAVPASLFAIDRQPIAMASRSVLA
jgi:glycine/D-amino acid oxidase-like deaminating enzyme